MNIIAYGSLLNKKSLEKTLARRTDLYKIIIPGVKRIFNAPFGEYSYLNLQMSKGSTIETAYFTLQRSEINKFAKREAGSELTELLPGYYAFIWPNKLCKELPVLQSYIDICKVGAENLDVDFWKNTIRPVEIIDDRNNAQYI